MPLSHSEVIEKRRMEQSLEAFIKGCWNIIEPTQELVWSLHHSHVCRFVEQFVIGNIRRALLRMPPAYTKSTIASVCAVPWAWTCFPGMQFLRGSCEEGLSGDFSQKSRALVESGWYQDRWGHKTRLMPDQNQKLDYHTTAGGRSLSVGRTGGTGHHFDRIIIDDALKIEERYSPAACATAIRWVENTLEARGFNDIKKGCILVVGHCLSLTDLTQRLADRGDYTHLFMPQEYEPDRKCVIHVPGFDYEDWRTESGELLWPERYDDGEVERIKLRWTDAAYSCLFQQNPKPDGGNLFKAEHVKYFETTQGGEAVVLHHSQGAPTVFSIRDCERIGILDPAGTPQKSRQDNKPCYTAMICGLITPQKDILLWDVNRGFWSIPDGVDVTEIFFKQNRIACFGIEENGLGLGYTKSLINRGVPVRAIRAIADKVARSQTAQCLVRNGKVYLRKGAGWVKPFFDELTTFPDAEYVDQVDCLSHLSTLVGFSEHTPTTLTCGGGVL